jgi:hypothetical protein
MMTITTMMMIQQQTMAARPRGVENGCVVLVCTRQNNKVIAPIPDDDFVESGEVKDASSVVGVEEDKIVARLALASGEVTDFDYTKLSAGAVSCRRKVARRRQCNNLVVLGFQFTTTHLVVIMPLSFHLHTCHRTER